jgi:hypothetical protein
MAAPGDADLYQPLHRAQPPNQISIKIINYNNIPTIHQ